VDQLKDFATQALQFLDTGIGLLPDSIKTLIQPFLQYKDQIVPTLFNNLDQYGPMASSVFGTLAAVLPQFAIQLASLVGLPADIVTSALSLLTKVTNVTNELTQCRGWPKDCTGIIKALGLAISMGLPLVQAQIPSSLAFLVKSYFTDFSNQAQKMQTGDVGGLKSMLTSINGIIKLAGAFIPAIGDNMPIIKMLMDLLAAIARYAGNCNQS
jgi:hypothetical protein